MPTTPTKKSGTTTSTDQQIEGGGGGEGRKGRRRVDGGEDTCSSPNTAHAVLDEGSLECLALSKRGLFAAGKVSLTYMYNM